MTRPDGPEILDETGSGSKGVPLEVGRKGRVLLLDPPEVVEAGAPHDIDVRLAPDTAGHVEAFIVRDGEARTPAEVRQLDAERFTVRLPALDGGDEITVEIASRADGEPEPARDGAVFHVRGGEPPRPDTHPEELGVLLPEGERERARDAIRSLSRRGIRSATDLLANTHAVEELPGPQRRIVRKLAAHAALALTTDDAAARKELIAAGYGTPSEIAATPVVELHSQMPKLSFEHLKEIHRIAATQTMFLAGLQSAPNPIAGLTPGPDGRCGCEDCEAATSPLSYLANLIAYIRASATYTVEMSGFPDVSSVDVELLTQLLQQPLADLVLSCRAAEDPVRRVRLVIETLRRHLRNAMPPDADVVCGAFPLPLEHIVAGDVDGDHRDELIVAFRTSAGSFQATPAGVLAGYWVMDFDPVARRWSHLRPEAGELGADFTLAAGLVMKKTVCADVDGDGRDEVIVAVGRGDGAPDAQLGRTWFWIFDYDPVQRSWSHLLPGRFQQTGADLSLDDASLSFADVIAADVDGDGRAEVAVAMGSSATPNAFWVFQLVDQAPGPTWSALSPGGDASLPAFECDPPQTGYASYRTRMAFAADVDQNGRQEILAVPDGPSRIGAGLWAMAYEPPVPAGTGAVGTWHHVSQNPGLAGTDAAEPWPWPAPAQHAFAASTHGLNRPSIIRVPDVSVGTSTSDLNRLYDQQHDPTGTDPWTAAEEADAGTDTTTKIAAAFGADVDDDLSDELVAVVKSGSRRAAWIMDRQPNGQWQHLSQIQGDSLGADLVWTTSDSVFRGALGADVDRVTGGGSTDTHTELVFYGAHTNDIWVLRFDEDTQAWSHLSPVLQAGFDAPYLLATYEQLLAQMGTSFDELREVRGAPEAERADLAARLGLPVTDPTSGESTLDALTLEPADLSEEILEELFGLAATTRNPLSLHAVRKDGRRQIERIELEGAVWSRNPWVANVGRNGVVRIALAKQPSGKIRVDVSRPDGLHVASGTGDPSSRIRLASESGSDLTGWVQLAYAQDTTAIEVDVFPRVAAWRLDRLRDIWDEQDNPPSPYETGDPPGEPVLPAIDPDIVGPDDFRVPLEKATGGSSNGAFDVWVSRRGWVDARLAQLEAAQPNLDAMMRSLRPPPGPAPPVPEDYPWTGAPAVSNFPSLVDAVVHGDANTAAGATATIRSKLWLPPDAFLRLMALASRLGAAGELGDAEWEEVRSILVLALKRRRYASWRAEEQAAQVGVEPLVFVPAARPPAEGAWPVIPVAAEPLVDPDRVALADLPLAEPGAAARGFWRARRAQLAGSAATIRGARPAGFEAMLVAALGPAPAGTTWRPRLASIAQDLDSPTSATAAAARAAAESVFGVDAGALRRLAAVEAKISAGDAPADAEWLDVDAVLTSGGKRKALYPTWLAEEQTLGAAFPYWRARRAALPLWRASAEHRQAWEGELRRNSRPAAVDPDRTPATRLRRRAFGEPTWTLYNARRTWLASREQALAALRQPQASPLAQLDAILLGALYPAGTADRLAADLRRRRQARSAAAVVGDVFGVGPADVAALRADLTSTSAATAATARVRAAHEFWLDPTAFDEMAATLAKTPGNVTQAEWDAFDRTLAAATLVGRIAGLEAEAKAAGLRSRTLVARLGLRTPTHAQLLRTREIAATGGPVLESEWGTVVSIAVGAEKLRRTGEWLAEELGSTPDKRVRLGPDSFVTAVEDDSAEQADGLRVTAEEIKAWNDVVSARAEQEGIVLSAGADAVGRVEEQTLPILRDALIAAIAPPGGDGASWVTDHFLVDARAGGCDLTTRAAHAIDTLLALLWSLRTGQLRRVYPQVSLITPSFDAEWRWIGSYTTWRSAMLVRLYPENLLRPSLRQRRSPPFAEILADLRSGRELTPLSARQLAGRYGAYFRDICTLDLDTLACTRVVGWAREPAGKPGAYDFLFAASEGSARVYWSTLAVAGPSATIPLAQSYWDVVPTLGSGDVVGFAGAAAYRPATATPQAAMTSGWVYLFSVTRDLQKSTLVYSRYNLVTRRWEDRQELQSPAGEFTARVLAGVPSQPPRISFEVVGEESGRRVTRFYVASLNAKGTGWDADGLEELPQWAWAASAGALARAPRDLIAVDVDGDGLVELAGVPAGVGPIEFHSLADGTLRSRGLTSRQIEAGSRVCAGDFDADRRGEIAWTLEARPGNAGRSTAVLFEKRGTDGQWRPQFVDPQRTDGASAAATNRQIPATFLVAGDLDGVNGDEIMLAIEEHVARIDTGGEITVITGSWNAFWSIGRFGNAYKRNSPFTYVPDPELRTQYDLTDLQAAFACGGGDSAAAFGLTGDFDGDGRMELVVFVAAKRNSATNIGDDLSRGNDFWALDRRASDGKLRPMGVVAQNPLHAVGDLSETDTFVAGAIAADVDGDGRHELVAIPYIKEAARGSTLWVADFRPGGAADPADGGEWRMLPDLDLSSETTPVAHAIAADLDGDGADELVLFGSGKTWVRKYDVLDGEWRALPDLSAVLPHNATVAAAAAGKFRTGNTEQVVVALGTVTPQDAEEGRSYNFWDDHKIRASYERAPASSQVYLLSLTSPRPGAAAVQCSHMGIKPVYGGGEDAWILDDTTVLGVRRAQTRRALLDNAGAAAAITSCLWEAFYDLPIAIALQLQRSRHFTEALDWFRLAFDYTAAPGEAKTFFGLAAEETIPDAGFDQPLLDWLHDPLDVHAIAATRPGTFTRATLLLIVNCLLDFGDAEFTVDTSESIERARLLYERALALLGMPELDQSLGGCTDVIGRILARLAEPDLAPSILHLANKIATTPISIGSLEEAVSAMVDAAGSPRTTDKRLAQIEAIASRTLRDAPMPPTLTDTRELNGGGYATLLREPSVAAATARIGGLLNGSGDTATAAYAISSVVQPAQQHWFCVGPNPLLKALRLHAELSLYKIRTCRNITGLRRSLDFYSGATDQVSGLPMIGANGQLFIPSAAVARPTPYRYSALIARARELAGIAQQLEALMLAALERGDAEAYSLLQARQNAQLARETVRLNELQVRQAEDRVLRADLQQERAQIEQDHFTELLAAGETEHEREALALLADALDHERRSATLAAVAGIAYGITAAAYVTAAYFDTKDAATLLASAAQNATQSISTFGGMEATLAQARSLESQMAAQRAGLERMRQDWQLRQRLATQDILIAAQDTRVEEDGVRIAEQQRTVSQLESDNAEQLVDFLHNKFTSVDLYDWMSGVLESAYSSVLQHATGTARLAAAQLAFERQGEPPPAIALDYWQAPTENGAGGDDAGAIDRRGLTGAERLLRDLVELDQFAFETDRRKLQLSKTLSLAQLAPLELERLRTTGVASFATPSELFDRDFPGHYMRLTKRVTVSVVALVPPTEGVHATLLSSGISRVVVGPEIFQPIVVRRAPQSVGLTTPVGASGVFTFEPRTEFTNPFELDGVDTSWEFRMPPAGNRFDFDTIADVLVTLDYTALESDDYAQQVVRRLARRFDGERAFSIRHDFPDTWWDLHNPDQTATPMSVAFDVSAADFPPNVDDVEIEHVAVAVSSRSPVPRGLTVRLRFAETPAPGEPPVPATSWLPASPVEGIASTRRGNASAWLALIGKRPQGRWYLSIPDTDEIREWLEAEELSDLLVVLSYSGRTPPWPT